MASHCGSDQVILALVLDLPTNTHHYLYDLNRREVSGELFNGSPIFFNQDHTKLFCTGHESMVATFKGRIINWIKKVTRGNIRLPVNRGEAFWLLDEDLNLPNEPAAIGAFAQWNGRTYDTYFALANSTLGGNSFLLRADKTVPALKLVYRDFQFEWLGRLDEAGTRYLYSGEFGQPGRGGNGGVLPRNLTNNTSRTVVEPDSSKQYAGPQFYGEDIIYRRNRQLWRLAPGETNGTRILPPTSN
jgi:hypothetical protein